MANGPFEMDEDYLRAFEAIRYTRVVNDSAERGVKLITDFQQSLTANKQEQQFLLQLVSKHRSKFPTCSKSALVTK